MKLTGALAFLWILIWLVAVIAVIWVGIHFIHKFW